MTTPTAFHHFCHLVLQDVQLQEKLRAITNRAAFIHQMVALGEVHGYRFTVAEVNAALHANRRTWQERWLV